MVGYKWVPGDRKATRNTAHWLVAYYSGLPGFFREPFCRALILEVWLGECTPPSTKAVRTILYWDLAVMVCRNSGMNP